jgi:hypothetical protein
MPRTLRASDHGYAAVVVDDADYLQDGSTYPRHVRRMSHDRKVNAPRTLCSEIIEIDSPTGHRLRDGKLETGCLQGIERSIDRIVLERTDDCPICMGGKGFYDKVQPVGATVGEDGVGIILGGKKARYVPAGIQQDAISRAGKRMRPTSRIRA